MRQTCVDKVSKFRLKDKKDKIVKKIARRSDLAGSQSQALAVFSSDFWPGPVLSSLEINIFRLYLAGIRPYRLRLNDELREIK